MDEQEETQPLEGVHWNPIINSGFRDDRLERDIYVVRYSSVWCFIMDMLKSNPETHWVVRKRAFLDVWRGLI